MPRPIAAVFSDAMLGTPGSQGRPRAGVARSRPTNLVRCGGDHEIYPAFSGSPEVVLQALDVVFTEVAATLHLDEGEGLRPRVCHPVSDAGGDVDRITCGKREVFTVASDDRPAGDHMPVLRPAPVTLQAQAPARPYHDAFDLMDGLVFQHAKETPRPLVVARWLIWRHTVHLQVTKQKQWIREAREPQTSRLSGAGPHE